MAVVNIAESALQDEKANHVADTTTLIKGCLDAIALMGHTSRELSNRRKNNIKYSLHADSRDLCSPEKPTTKYLLGDDVSKGAKEAKELASLAKKPMGNFYNKNYSSSTARKHPYNKERSRYVPYQKEGKPYKNQTSFLGRGRKSQQNYTPKKK